MFSGKPFQCASPHTERARVAPPACSAEVPADENQKTGSCGSASSILQELEYILVQVCARQQTHGPIVSTRHANEPGVMCWCFRYLAIGLAAEVYTICDLFTSNALQYQSRYD